MENNHLKRNLGLWPTTLSGVGIILGAGIYVIIGAATQDAGSAVWISFLLAALIAGLTGLSYAELASIFPDAGASPIYVQHAFGDRAGFLLGWLRLIVSVVAMAAVAIGFSGYFGYFFDVSPQLVSISVIAVSCVIVLIGVRETVAMAIVMTLLEAGGLIFIVVFGLPEIGSRSLVEMPYGWIELISGASLIFFAFEGFEQIATLSEETHNPTRNIPKAILIAIGITAVLYVAVAITSTSILDWTLLAESDSPLSDVARAVSGPSAANILAIITLFATFNTVLMMLATAARRAYGMAGSGMLPPLFRRLLPGASTPWVAAVVLSILASVVVFMGDIRFAAEAANYSVFFSYLVINGAVVYLRFKSPHLDRPFVIPLKVGPVTILPVLSSAGILLLALFGDIHSMLFILIALLAGLIVSVWAIKPHTS